MIDWSRLEELNDEVGEEDFAEIAGLFLCEIEEAVADLPGLTDNSARSDALHGMKGSARNVGFTSLADLCAAGEADPGNIDMSAVTTALQQSVQALRERYPDLVS